MNKKIIPLLLTLFLVSACKPDEPRNKNNAASTEKSEAPIEASTGATAVTANSSKESDAPVETVLGEFSKNNHTYSFDVVTGATNGAYEGTAYTGKEKQEKMYWSGRPELGEIIGDYYHEEYEFDGGYVASLDVVKKDDQLIAIEFDEKGPDNYYSADWAGETKRLSGYADFQAANNRTDITLVTIVNAMTFLEHQMLEQNSLTGDFYSVRGSSNSVRNGYIPAANKLSERIANESKEKYYGLTKELGEGLYGRLIIIKDKDTNKIIDAKYDEYFADTQEEINDADLKQYSRQSKYQSRTYSEESNQNFKKLADELQKEILNKQTLKIDRTDSSLQKNYSQFIDDMNNMLTK
ncbi:hypothetical protein [Enterococcus sp. AZ126]|uniref:hypothetical protein n=1 Tax=Enterococcus sp. AZ126 TaxID=2774635 RepID=UPI003F239D4D